jgi:hypothetical protein
LGFSFLKFSARVLLNMAEAHLQAELAEAKSEIRRLTERMSVGALTVHKDLSLVTLVPNCLGQTPRLL